MPQVKKNAAAVARRADRLQEPMAEEIMEIKRRDRQSRFIRWISGVVERHDQKLGIHSRAFWIECGVLGSSF